MGQKVPRAVEDERTKWAADHVLQINPEIQAWQRSWLRHFRSKLHLCWYPWEENGIKFQHFFVTDNDLTMEFLSTGVQVHRNTLRLGFFVDASFEKTEEVESRMSRLCGATAYSVTLRNCEHLARYIHSGSWVSYQMLEGSYLGASFVEYMMDEHLKKLNRLPFELRIHGPGGALFPQPEYGGFLRHIASPEGLSRADEEAFNVLVVGPSGCGKSRLINLLFNKIVAESKASAASVTRQIKTYSGTGLINLCQRKVNLIDTIGLCDSFISEDIVLRLIQDSLRINFAYLDQVVVICSGRIEFRHAENIRQILEWLRYHKYKGNFTFIYNKVDQMAMEERENGVSAMCQFLGVQRFALHEIKSGEGFFHGDRVRFQPRERPRGAIVTIPKCFATGFPEAPFHALSNDLGTVVDSVFAAPERIPVEESWCSIL